MQITASISGVDKVIEKLDKLAKPNNEASGIKVGIVKTAKYPIEVMKGRQKRTTSPTVAQVAFWNEFGTRGGGWGGPIPERPFMRDSIQRFKDDIRVVELLRQIFISIDPGFRRDTANLLGVLLKGLMQSQITDGNYAPNAPSTIRIKRRGRTGDPVPLIDTGLMRRSIDYEIVE